MNGPTWKQATWMAVALLCLIVAVLAHGTGIAFVLAQLVDRGGDPVSCVG